MSKISPLATYKRSDHSLESEENEVGEVRNLRSKNHKRGRTENGFGNVCQGDLRGIQWVRLTR